MPKNTPKREWITVYIESSDKDQTLYSFSFHAKQESIERIVKAIKKEIV